MPAKTMLQPLQVRRMYRPLRGQARSCTRKPHKQKRPDQIGAFGFAELHYAAIDVFSLFIALFSS